MKSLFLMGILLVVYGAIALVSAVEHKWWLTLYWISAATLNLAVLMMNK